MAAGYFEAGRQTDTATFELSIRRLPFNRNFVVVAGLEQALDYLQNLRFTPDEIRYLRGMPVFAGVSPAFFDYLAGLRFRCDVWTVPEGTVLFAGEPVMTVRGPLIEAQIVETYLLAALTFPTLIASKAARMVTSAAGRAVVEFGTRRAHTAEAGVLGARAAWIAGCAGTSNVEAGYRFGIPVLGTAAHSWVMSFASEREAFRKLQQVLGASTVHLIDTYDPLEGVRRVAALGRPLWGIRLDSGDFERLAREARGILDSAGLADAKIMASGDLNEWRIAELVRARAPIDAFGVGTELATSQDAPSMGVIYKLVEVEENGVTRPTAKFSQDKQTWPGAKQIHRLPEKDVIALDGEQVPGEVLLRQVLRGGEAVAPRETLETARTRSANSIRRLPRELLSLEVVSPHPVERSTKLIGLVEKTRGNG